MIMNGDEIVMNRKHTTRLNVVDELTKAFDRYKDGSLVLQRNIEVKGRVAVAWRCPTQAVRSFLPTTAAGPDACPCR